MKCLTIKSICEARFWRANKRAHVHARVHRYVPVHITLLTSWLPDIMPAWRQSLWQPVSAHARKGKEEWELHRTHRHSREQRIRNEERYREECSLLLLSVRSFISWGKFTSGLGSFQQIFGKSPGFMKQENTGNSYIFSMLNGGSSNRERVEQYILTVLIFLHPAGLPGK